MVENLTSEVSVPQEDNNKHESSLKHSCHLRPSLNTTQICESVSKIRTTIDQAVHKCDTLKSKIAHKNI